MPPNLWLTPGRVTKQNPNKPTSFLFLDSNVPQFVAKKRKRSTTHTHPSPILKTPKTPRQTTQSSSKIHQSSTIPQTSNNTLKKVKICNRHRNKYGILKLTIYQNQLTRKGVANADGRND